MLRSAPTSKGRAESLLRAWPNSPSTPAFALPVSIPTCTSAPRGLESTQARLAQAPSSVGENQRAAPYTAADQYDADGEWVVLPLPARRCPTGVEYRGRRSGSCRGCLRRRASGWPHATDAGVVSETTCGEQESHGGLEAADAQSQKGDRALSHSTQITGGENAQRGEGGRCAVRRPQLSRGSW